MIHNKDKWYVQTVLFAYKTKECTQVETDVKRSSD